MIRAVAVVATERLFNHCQRMQEMMRAMTGFSIKRERDKNVPLCFAIYVICGCVKRFCCSEKTIGAYCAPESR